tara:strand:- start:1058 stop:2977 length:1920 start_codon:yes stop_codon:yes gene_type:complete
MNQYLKKTRIKIIILFLLLIYFSFPSEISQHFLGVNFDINNKSATFIDKFKCTANPHFEFTLSAKLNVKSVSIDDVPKEYIISKKSKSKYSYKIKRNIWEPKDALITVRYQTNSDSLFKEIKNNKLIQLNADEIYYPKGIERSTKLEIHLQVSNDWSVVSNENIIKLKDKKNSYKISSNISLKQLNLFFLKNYNKTPQFNDILLNLYSNELDKTEKDEFITLFFKKIKKIESLLGPFPNTKIDLILSDFSFSSNSLIFFNQKTTLEEVIFNQYFKHNIYPYNNKEIFWIYAIQAYFLEYIPLLDKSYKSANLFRKEILNSHSKSLIPQNLILFSDNIYNQYKIQTYLFLLFTLEDYFGKNKLINLVQEFLSKNKNKLIDDLKFYQYLFSKINPNFSLDFYFSERFNNEINYSFFEIIESDKSISILQPEKVLPIFIPLRFHHENGKIQDSLLFTKSFKTNIFSKIDDNIIKIEVDKNNSCLRKLHETELEIKIKDIYYYKNIQIVISSKLKNNEKIKSQITKHFKSKKLDFVEYENINPSWPAIIIGDLPSEYKYLSTKYDLILNGRKFYLKNHCLAYTFNNQKSITNLIIYSKSSIQILPLIEKLNFFKNYSYFVLRNGNNADKGFHKTHSKQLIWEN